QVYTYQITGRRTLRTTGNHRLLVCHRQPKWGKPPSAGGTSGLRDHELPEWLAVDDGEDLREFAAATPTPLGVEDRDVVDLITYAPPTYGVVENRLVAFTHSGTRENPKQSRPPATIPVDEDFCRL